MRTPRRLTVTVCALGLTFSPLLVAGTARAAAVEYVALGDSYSSGVGAGSYIDEGCKRSSNAYPQLWADANGADSFSFVACSGATTGDVASEQLSALGSGTTLVSITVGGNDAGFSSVMTTCVTNSDSACVSKAEEAQTFARDVLPGRLDDLYTQIRDRAPNAEVVVLSYPRLYTITDSCAGLSNTKRTALNEAADTLATETEKEVAEAGFTFADARDTFAGHELCSGDDWLNAVTWPIGDSYHPTARGQENGYLPAISSATADVV